MHQSEGRQTLRLALGAAIAGFAWAWLRHRRHPHRATLALTQAAEWFVACGGAATLVDRLRVQMLGMTPPKVYLDPQWSGAWFGGG